MTKPAKFTFDLDLARTSAKTKLMEEKDLDLLIAQAREQGFNEGLEQGQQSVLSETNRQIAAATEQLANRSADFLKTLDNAQKHHLAQSTKLAATIGHKLAAHLVEHNPTPEITALLEDCLASLGSTAHLVIRCNDQLSDQIKPITEQLAHQAGFDGRLIIMGEPEFALGDCRIEWSDGGLARNFENLAQEIDQKVMQFVSQKTPKVAPLDDLPADDATQTPNHPEEIQ
ncbi:FliH/SctL family protein [Maritalea porphyrae]|uniref:FliH/SctL family protein n=1 Tax=Maritalea porphyrae TaxID=880732 RepID=UPI0022B05A9A|nr:FliH/SctL family protein [Maritalea porphyrae]MCZ4273618.1 FliH/SctL family protein [Maritalea porphyrae]